MMPRPVRNTRAAPARCCTPAGPAVLTVAVPLALVLVGACNSRALIEVDVTGDTPFQAVTLRLTAGGTTKDFASASFGADASTAFKAGIYVGDSGEVTVTARALDGSGSCIGIGQSSAANVQAG